MADHLGGGISNEDMKWAIKQYEAYVNNAREVVGRYIQEEISGRDTERIERVEQFIREHGEVSRRELTRHFHLRVDELSRILATLEEAGAIEVKEARPEGRGRPSLVVKCVEDEEGGDEKWKK